MCVDGATPSTNIIAAIARRRVITINLINAINCRYRAEAAAEAADTHTKECAQVVIPPSWTQQRRCRAAAAAAVVRSTDIARGVLGALFAYAREPLSAAASGIC